MLSHSHKSDLKFKYQIQNQDILDIYYLILTVHLLSYLITDKRINILHSRQSSYNKEVAKAITHIQNVQY